jgi:hypothetical protein
LGASHRKVGHGVKWCASGDTKAEIPTRGVWQISDHRRIKQGGGVRLKVQQTGTLDLISADIQAPP